jgi:trehalose 6-phosphate phosphatase
VRYLLSSASRSILTRLSQERTLCAFDFDGTLAPIVAHPGQAGLREVTRLLLGRLATEYPCVILSGRSRVDLLDKLGGVGVKRVIGNHGAETEGTPSSVRKQVGKWKTAIEVGLGPVPGLWVEDKGHSLAVHYRQSPRKAETRRRIFEATKNLEKVRVFGGKQVVNLVVDGAPNKGHALAAERDRTRCAWVLYVGDDENDEDAFALDGNLISVRVGRKKNSHARYYLRTQSEVDQLLCHLVRLREPVVPLPG